MADERNIQAFGERKAMGATEEESLDAARQAAVEGEEERQGDVRQARILEFKIEWMQILVEQTERELEELTSSPLPDALMDAGTGGVSAPDLGEPPLDE